jgi:phosphate-selective porin OprO/OprP
MGKTKFALLGGTMLATVALLTAPAIAASKTKQPTNQELLERIEQLEQEVKSGKESQNTRITVLEDNAKAVQWSFDNGRPVVKSGDGRFELQIRARFQADGAFFMQDDNLPATVPASDRDLSSGAVIRRAYFGIQGTAFKDFLYEFRLNVGGSANENGDPLLNLARIAWIGIPHFRVNVGVIQPIFTLGDTVSSGQLTYIEKDELVNIATGVFGGGDGRRGVELTYQQADLFHSGDNLLVSGAFTGGTSGSSTGHGTGGDEQTQVLGRAAYRLWSDGTSNIQVGGSGAAILHRSPTSSGLTLSDRPEIRVDGTSLVSAAVPNVHDGNMWAVDGGANIKNFYVSGEYHHYKLDRTEVGIPDPDFSGWYVEGTWILTGEPKTYSASAGNNEIGSWGMPKVVKPFSISGNSWGAWEIGVRYTDLDLNFNEHTTALAGGIAGGEQKIVAVGLNWYMNNNIRLMINDLIVDVDRLTAPAAVTNRGQDFNVVAARLQFQM